MQGLRLGRAWARVVVPLRQLLEHCGWMMLGFQREARLGRAVRIEILHALTDGHWEVQAVALEALLALAAGPSEA